MGTLRKKQQAAFTLIELLVVVIIVAILAAVGVPMLSANVQRARASEADAGVGTWRTGIRAFLSENGGTFPTGTTTVTLTQAGLKAVDFSGRWFNNAAYANVTTAGAATYCISVDGDNTTVAAAQKAQVSAGNRIARSMDQDGNLGDDVCTGAGAIGGTKLN